MFGWGPPNLAKTGKRPATEPFWHSLLHLQEASMTQDAKYSVVQFLGAESYGTSYLAKSQAGEFVELRKLKADWLAKNDGESLSKQLSILQLCKSKSILRLIDFDLQAAEPFLVVALSDSDRQGRRWTEDISAQMPQESLHSNSLRLADALSDARLFGFSLRNISTDSILISSNDVLFVDLTRSIRMEQEDTDYLETNDSIGLSDLISKLNRLNGKIISEPLQRIADSLRTSSSQGQPSLRQSISYMTQVIDSSSAGMKSSSNSNSEFSETVNIDSPVLAVSEIDLIASGQLAKGMELGRYTIQRKLGEGGMGAVYEATDNADGKRVAIKVLISAKANPNLRRRFAKEARLLAKANNPYVANLLECYEEAETPYIVVEFITGGTLSDNVESAKRMPEQACLRIATDIARGLGIAHGRGIIHRDIKPENVLITEAGAEWMRKHNASTIDSIAMDSLDLQSVFAKLSDFGLARFTEQSESLAMTRDGALLGTPIYMSPEQCKGLPTDARSDVYSFGAMLFHLLTGRPPFQSDSQAGLLNLHCTEPAPDIKQIQPSLSDACAQAIAKCLAKNPDARYPDANALLADLESMLHGRPTSLGLHPPILNTDDPRALKFVHQWDFASSPAELWPFVSNTDRVNHAIGLPSVTYTTNIDPVHGVERFAEAKVSGQKIRWREHPYEWIEGKRLSVLREFTHGPFDWFANVVELAPIAGGGTRITQSLHVLPRGWLGKLIAKIQLGSKSKENFGKAYGEVDRFLTQNRQRQADQDPFGRRMELAGNRLAKFTERIARLKAYSLDPLVVDTLGQFIEHASDLEVARIRPIAMAERFKLDASQMIQACLLGAKEGLLTLLWDILCPSCRIPSGVLDTLSNLKDHSYCEACDIRFELDMAKSVELIFQVHPEIRTVETKTYCIGGPAWSKHVVAQVRLAAEERMGCELELGEGTYLIRGPQLPFVDEFRVTPAGTQGQWDVPLSRPIDRALIPRLKPNQQVVFLVNDTPQDLMVRIERTAARQDALTAAQASSLALFRELFPQQVLSAGQMVSIAHTTILLLRIHGLDSLYAKHGDAAGYSRFRKLLDLWYQRIADNQGAVVKILGHGLQASFADTSHALDALKNFLQTQADEEELSCSLAIHSGSAMVANIDSRIDYFGKTVQQTWNIIEQAQEGDCVLSDPVWNIAASEIAQWIPKGDKLSNYVLSASSVGLESPTWHKLNLKAFQAIPVPTSSTNSIEK